MGKKRVHGGRTLEQKVVSMYREGWHVPNIASIVQVDADTVREIISRSDVLID